MNKKSSSFVYKFVVNCQVPYKAENWHALSHEHYFSKHRFLDICRVSLILFYLHLSENLFLETPLLNYLYVLNMSRTRVRVNSHSIVA